MALKGRMEQSILSKSLQKRQFPKWLGAILVFIGFPTAHVLVPWLLAGLSPHHGWHNAIPGFWNLLALAPLAAGGFVAVFCLAAHLSSMPRRFEFRRTPEYLLTWGPYRFSRNPLYIAEGLLWFGWAAFYGSAWVSGVVIAMILLSRLLIGQIVRREERDLVARFGDRYREYARRVPRCI